jgi:hypothetical protein
VIGARIEQSERVELPRLAVEVASKKPAVIVLEQRIDADRVLTAQVLFDRLVAQRKVGLRAVAPAAPAARDSWRISALASAGVLPTQRIDIVSASEEVADQRDLCDGRRGRDDRRTLSLGAGASVSPDSDDRLRAQRQREQRS